MREEQGEIWKVLRIGCFLRNRTGGCEGFQGIWVARNLHEDMSFSGCIIFGATPLNYF